MLHHNLDNIAHISNYTGPFLNLYVSYCVFLSGFSISAMNISSEGIFIEITTDENRALHKGMVGATSLSIAIFPIIAGWLIGHLGFAFIFLLSSVMAGTSYYFVNNLEIPPAGSN